MSKLEITFDGEELSALEKLTNHYDLPIEDVIKMIISDKVYDYLPLEL